MLTPQVHDGKLKGKLRQRGDKTRLIWSHMLAYPESIRGPRTHYHQRVVKLCSGRMSLLLSIQWHSNSAAFVLYLVLFIYKLLKSCLSRAMAPYDYTLIARSRHMLY